MKSLFTCLIALLSWWHLEAQTTATFESFNVPLESFLNGSEGSGGFSDGNIFLPNTYDSNYDFWSGWAISNTTDALTPGYTNQYSAIAGSGYDNSGTYAVAFASPSVNVQLSGDAEGGSVAGLYVTNSTYAYLSMLNGDGFAKKFGGETGDDPDFFLLTIKKYLNGELGADSVDFYLADYRSVDNSQDYLVKDWTYIDLRVLGNADSLQFSLSSSDVGQFGINTPTYFCVDNITTLDRPTAIRDYRTDLSITLFPNPTTDWVTVDWKESNPGRITLCDAAGKSLQQQTLTYGDNHLDLQDLPAGQYVLRLETDAGWSIRKLVKQ